jgi:hypothetical protein
VLLDRLVLDVTREMQFQLIFQAVDAGRVALGHQFDRSIRAIPDVTPNAAQLSELRSRKPEADSLDPSKKLIPPCFGLRIFGVGTHGDLDVTRREIGREVWDPSRSATAWISRSVGRTHLAAVK